jgi:hypothetical protein
VVEHGGADGRDLGPETLADLRHLPRNVGEAVAEGAEVEGRPADEQDLPAASPDSGDRRRYVSEPTGDVVGLGRGDDVDEVVRKAAPFGRPRFGGANVEPPVTAIESTLTISAPRRSAIRIPREVFPAAVGPARNQQSSPSSGRDAAPEHARVGGVFPGVPGKEP